jgi:hypothetical protein
MEFSCVYLSETGVGETIGERIHQEASSHGLVCKLYNSLDFKKVRLVF